VQGRAPLNEMYALGLFEGVIDRLGALVRDLCSMAGSLILLSNGTLMVIFLLGLLAWGLYWWRAR
jgi:hypothetical protein